MKNTPEKQQETFWNGHAGLKNRKYPRDNASYASYRAGQDAGKPAAKTGAQRVRESEIRKQERGLRKTWVWAYPDDRQVIHKYADRLRKKRERAKSG